MFSGLQGDVEISIPAAEIVQVVAGRRGESRVVGTGDIDKGLLESTVGSIARRGEVGHPGSNTRRCRLGNDPVLVHRLGEVKNVINDHGGSGSGTEVGDALGKQRFAL